VTFGTDLDAAIADAPDVLMMLRVQQERMHAAFFPHEREYATGWGLDDDRFRRLGPDTIVMHPGPMNRGLEISAAAADSPQAVILDQVTNGVSIRMAVLYLVLSGSGSTEATE
jgi:aspartate carbamoyltransferase catalytic subunit